MKYAQSEEKRYVIDAIIRVNITAHEILAVKCPLCGEMKKAEFPEDVKAYVQYGENLKALVIALNTVGAVSVNRVHKILGSVFDIPLSTGMISNTVSDFADQIYEEGHTIRRRISKADVVHFDETGIRINGKLKWIHVASTADDTYLYLGPQRGKKGMDTGKILPRSIRRVLFHLHKIPQKPLPLLFHRGENGCSHLSTDNPAPGWPGRRLHPRIYPSPYFC